LRERLQHGKLAVREVVHDLARVVYVLLLVVIALHKSIHRRDGGRSWGSVVQLLVHCRKVVIRIGIELALPLRQRHHLRGFICRVEVALVSREAVDPGIDCLQRPEHVVKGAVLHHQYDDVLQVVQALRHGLSSETQ
jgi:hypothetical protein